MSTTVNRDLDRVIGPVDIAELRLSVAGPVLVPEDDRYAEEIPAWNTAVPQQPRVVVGVTTEDDVQAAVRFARLRGMPVAVAATGHGHVVASDAAVLVSTRRLDAVVVDAAARTVRIGAGALWQDVVDAAARHGLAPLAGSSADVGAVGYTLGGGLSPTLGRRYGFAADHVLSMRVVTADGALHVVDPEREPDLFWALRGGKGSFGVVTSLTARLFPVEQLYGGGLYFAAESARAVLRAWRDLAERAPDDLSTSVALLRTPPDPALPEPLRGRLVVHVRVAYLGAKEDAERLLRPLRATAEPVLDALRDLPLAETASIHADPPGPLPVLERSRLVAALPDAALDALLGAAGPERVGLPVTVVELRRLGGALARPPAVDAAVGHPDAAYALFTGTIAPPDGELAAAAAAGLDAVVAALQPWSARGRLMNFLSAVDTAPDAVRAAFDDPAYRRLQRIKAQVDPDNMFRVNHNIPPRPRRGPGHMLRRWTRVTLP
jgi:FAD/FMN-containing dehydrogenase